MVDTARIDPPIRFQRSDGSDAAIDAAGDLIAWLDALYDAILDPKRSERQSAGDSRAHHLQEIEDLLMRLEDEIDAGAASISEDLRIRAIRLIGGYRDLDMTLGRPPLHLRQPRGPRRHIA
ncbi:hypothetical protein E9232_003509 [Inquilinus ginsengisoli]|uniref:Flagellar protein FliT n=1 Tax=Inquilinus ginsengisoli TaxID=363840 RepID=A0ABU1JQS9_9PROT|nr:hypothetical protein [Inquilinus ginsengisoli]MDR6290983.1 hypothetical protein [Inquilinus ginsengisoli]